MDVVNKVNLNTCINKCAGNYNFVNELVCLREICQSSYLTTIHVLIKYIFSYT
jgi:hypothetical protein